MTTSVPFIISSLRIRSLSLNDLDVTKVKVDLQTHPQSHVSSVPDVHSVSGLRGCSPAPSSTYNPVIRSTTPPTTSPLLSPSVGGVSTLPGRISYSSVAGGKPSRGWGTTERSHTCPCPAPSLPPPRPSLPSPTLCPGRGRGRPGRSGCLLVFLLSLVLQVGPIKLTPPYLKATIEITVPVEDCSGYMYHIQLYGAKKVTSTINMPSVRSQIQFKYCEY